MMADETGLSPDLSAALAFKERWYPELVRAAPLYRPTYNSRDAIRSQVAGWEFLFDEQAWARKAPWLLEPALRHLLRQHRGPFAPPVQDFLALLDTLWKEHCELGECVTLPIQGPSRRALLAPKERTTLQVLPGGRDDATQTTETGEDDGDLPPF
jgi:hypothetical protein